MEDPIFTKLLSEAPLTGLVAYVVYRLKGLEDMMKVMSFNQRVVLSALLKNREEELKDEDFRTDGDPNDGDSM